MERSHSTVVTVRGRRQQMEPIFSPVSTVPVGNHTAVTSVEGLSATKEACKHISTCILDTNCTTASNVGEHSHRRVQWSAMKTCTLRLNGTSVTSVGHRSPLRVTSESINWSTLKNPFKWWSCDRSLSNAANVLTLESSSTRIDYPPPRIQTSAASRRAQIIPAVQKSSLSTNCLTSPPTTLYLIIYFSFEWLFVKRNHLWGRKF